MRIGGAFGFGQGAVAVPLAGGEAYYLAPGNYYIQLGSQSLLQVFDSINMIWRNIGFPGGNQQVSSPDGSNWRIINYSGVVQALQITNAGSGGTNGIGSTATGASISFGAAPANGIAAAAYPIVGGALSGLTIAGAGSAFIMPPMLFIDQPPPGGIQATATCTISAGAINAVTLRNAGAGYVAVPNVYIVPQFATYQGVGQPVNSVPPTNPVPPGAFLGQQPPFLPGVQWQPTTGGASITVNGITGSGTLTGAVMTNPGVGYSGTTIPTVAVSGGGIAGGVAATAVMSLAVTSLGTGGTGGVGYSIGAPWVSSYGQLVGTDGCNGICGSRPARGLIKATTGFTGTPASVEDNGFGLQTVPNIGVLFFGTDITTVSTTTAVCGGVYDVSIINPAVDD